MALVTLFRREQGTEASNPIHFDQRLLDTLVQDHRRLIRQLQRLRKTAIDQHYAALPKLLGEFRSLLQTHLMTENVRLYGYLSYSLPSLSEEARRMAEFRREMYSIGHHVMTFVRHYQEHPAGAHNSETFLRELGELATLLVRRIRREEMSLFPLYQRPGRKAAVSARINPLTIGR